MSWHQMVMERNEHGPGTIRLHVDDDDHEAKDGANSCQIGPILLNNPRAKEVDQSREVQAVDDAQDQYQEAEEQQEEEEINGKFNEILIIIDLIIE